MDYIFNKEKLQQVFSDFYHSTGIFVALYDASMQCILGAPNFHSPYCDYIRKRCECIQNCNQSNLIHMKEVSSTRQISRYTCHGGLMETILPVIYEDVLIAYIQIGQFRDTEKQYSSVDKLQEVAKYYDFPLQELYALYEKQHVVSEEKLLSLYRILEIIVKSFWVDGLITYNRSMLSIKIEQYVTEHLTENFYVEDLCKHFYISKNTLYSLFHNEFHTTIGEWVTEKRLTLAKKHLKENAKLGIAQVASLCGFNDYNYFIRLFKKQVGITPLQFRKKFYSNQP